jgi:hypothetical protein
MTTRRFLLLATGWLLALASITACETCPASSRTICMVTNRFVDLVITGQGQIPQSFSPTELGGGGGSCPPEDDPMMRLIDAPSSFVGIVGSGFGFFPSAPYCTPASPEHEHCGKIEFRAFIAGPQHAGAAHSATHFTSREDIDPSLPGAYASWREYSLAGGDLEPYDSTWVEGTVTVLSTDPLAFEFQLVFGDEVGGPRVSVSGWNYYTFREYCVAKD